MRSPLWMLLLVLLLACDDEQAPEACAHVGDGVCDEPVNCSFGTDETDCSAACESGVDLHRHAAACAFRNPIEPPPDDGIPSGGAVHLTGHRDGTIPTPSGEDASRIVDRKYRLFVPESYDPRRSTPLVIMMSGHRASHTSSAGATELARVADHNRFIVAHADQEWRTLGERRWAWWSDWDWDTRADANPDLAFIRGLLDRIGGEYNVDLRRVFVAGHSRGGAMALIAAIEMPDIIAGACVQSGFSEFGYLETRLHLSVGRRAPVMLMHGDIDPDVPVTFGDDVYDALMQQGWQDGTDVSYHRLVNVAHRWQPWLNPHWYDFLHARPLPEDP